MELIRGTSSNVELSVKGIITYCGQCGHQSIARKWIEVTQASMAFDSNLLEALDQLSERIATVLFVDDLDIEGIASGRCESFTPIFSYVISRFSKPLFLLFSDLHLDRFEPSDTYKILHFVYIISTTIFHLKPALPMNDFVSEDPIHTLDKIEFTDDFKSESQHDTNQEPIPR
ncbi:hypothetical protein PROFUN_04893 [Planoprotostelium fungivorum]|uniref:Centrosomal CEP44 domain-containing protein n=1 Tax=Planoprotostelium fungivorum TaxID=1890364 RepID=A0A2P6NF76_9EUKA|nr:hypothetical protein PROFUN_04893 [Planoprotostelium fungivorum]